MDNQHIRAVHIWVPPSFLGLVLWDTDWLEHSQATEIIAQNLRCSVQVDGSILGPLSAQTAALCLFLPLALCCERMSAAHS